METEERTAELKAQIDELRAQNRRLIEERGKILKGVKRLRAWNRNLYDAYRRSEENLNVMIDKAQQDDETYKKLVTALHEQQGRLDVYERLFGKIAEKEKKK